MHLLSTREQLAGALLDCLAATARLKGDLGPELGAGVRRLLIGEAPAGAMSRLRG